MAGQVWTGRCIDLDHLQPVAELLAQAWRSFDRFRPEEPPLDDPLRAFLQAGLPEDRVPVREALDDAARILDESIAQPRPRYFAFIGSSGLEIGVSGDIGFLTEQDFVYQNFGESYLLEFSAPGWIQCAYNPPWLLEPGEEPDPEAGEDAEGAWSCPQNPPELW